MILRSDDTGPGYFATVGCNSIRGGLESEGDTLSFGPGAATMMACPPPLDEAEQALARALGSAATWRMTGTTLEVLDAGGDVVLQAVAVYLQ